MRRVADDAVSCADITTRCVGAAPENIRHFIELRGIGIVNVAVCSAWVQSKSEPGPCGQLWKHRDPQELSAHRTGSPNIEILGVNIPAPASRSPGMQSDRCAGNHLSNNRQKRDEL